MTDSKDLRDYLFRGLMFDSEADRFRNAGIQIGRDASESEFSLIAESLAPFGIDLRNDSLRMLRIYALIFCFENSVRELIRGRLQEKEEYGAEWWEKGVPQKIRTNADQRLANATDQSWLEGAKNDPLGFVDFGQLADIIVHNWEDFADLVPTQHWLKQRFDELEQARNFIAHNRILQDSEFQRIEMYISDWNKMVGL